MTRRPASRAQENLVSYDTNQQRPSPGFLVDGLLRQVRHGDGIRRSSYSFVLITPGRIDAGADIGRDGAGRRAEILELQVRPRVTAVSSKLDELHKGL